MDLSRRTVLSRMADMTYSLALNLSQRWPFTTTSPVLQQHFNFIIFRRHAIHERLRIDRERERERARQKDDGERRIHVQMYMGISVYNSILHGGGAVVALQDRHRCEGSHRHAL